jgi:uncharacterized membrane protein YeiH
MHELSRYVTFSTLVLVLDLCGTFVFALSGAAAGIKRRLDIFGVLVLSFVAANSGGIIRDLLIGAVPPPGIADWRYIAVPCWPASRLSMRERLWIACTIPCRSSTPLAWPSSPFPALRRL